MSARVLVIGDVMLDVVVRPSAPIAPTSDTPSRVRVGRGGSAANVAVALRAASPGSEVVFAGICGEDAAAQIVRSDLEGAGVLAQLTRVAGATGVVVSVVAQSGERSMMTDRGVNGRLLFEHVSSLLDESVSHVHISGYTVLDNDTRSLVSRLIAAATAVGASTSVDVCSVGPLREMGVEVFTRCAAGSTMLFANEEEALALSREDDVFAALEGLADQWREVVITRGANGAIARRDANAFEVSARVIDVVDTTGAGDCATGTYLAHRLGGEDVATSLEHAMEAAAQVVRVLGSRG